MNQRELDDLEKLAEELVSNHQRFMESLVRARSERGLSQEEVAYRMNVSQSAVSQFERYDSNPTLRTIRNYALAIGVGLRDDIVHRDSSWMELCSVVEDLDLVETPTAIKSDWVTFSKSSS